MFKFEDTNRKADLRRRNSFVDEIKYTNINTQACMVTLVVFIVLLLSVLSVVVATNPYAI